MINKDQFMDINHLKQLGQSIRKIARATGLSRNSVRKALRGGQPDSFQTPPPNSML